MQPADYRLVRSEIKHGIMIAVKQEVFSTNDKQDFSYWLYGETKSEEQISLPLPRSQPCLVCSDDSIRTDHFSLLNVDINCFLRSLPLLDNQQLQILYSLLDDDQQVYQCNIQQQYQQYRHRLFNILKQKI